MISRMSSINNTNGETITSYVCVDLGARRLLDFPRFVCLFVDLSHIVIVVIFFV